MIPDWWVNFCDRNEWLWYVLLIAFAIVVGLASWKGSRYLNWKWSYETQTKAQIEVVDKAWQERFDALEKRVAALEGKSHE